MGADETRERFEALFRDHYPAVRAYARRRADAEGAQDAVAEAFLVAWRRLDEVPPDPLPWLYGVARRTLANQRRSARRARALEDRVAAAARLANARDPAEPAGEADAVRIAFARLGADDREALALVAWEGLDNARAARAVGCTRAAFAVRLHRARRRLSQALEELERLPVPAGAAHDFDPMEAP